MNMKNTRTEEALRKRKETISNNIPQVSLPEERETHLNIDYFNNKIHIYSNNARVMNKMARKGLHFCKEYIYDGQICGRDYELPLSELKLVVNAGLFK